MRQALPNNLLHNPFYNRFNDPVTQRRDEMQSHENVVWLRERNEERQATTHPLWSRVGPILVEAFALLLVLLVSVSLLKGI